MEIENYTEEVHNINEFIIPEMIQDACWWYNNFNGFEMEMYAILEYGDKEMPEFILQYLKENFEERQNKLLERFENGGRDNPYEEYIQDELNYMTKDKVNEQNPTRDIFE